jgi:hypothetical protein
MLPLALAVPLVLVPFGAYLGVSEGSGGRLPVAGGTTGGVLHPIAGSFVPNGVRIVDCNGSYSCLEQGFGNVAFRDGPGRAIALFEARLESDGDVERDCHRILHTIGSATLARYQGDVARTFAEGTSTCASGYYHGILERAFAGITTKTELGKVARKLCIGVGIRRHSFLDYQCRHGLGHGFMIQTGYALPTALSLCSQLGTGWDRITCTSGAFMENVSTRFGFRSAWLDDKDPLFPCTELATRHRASCYVRATTWILQLENNDFARTAAVCRSASSPWSAACFRGFGRDAVVDARYRAFGHVHALCALTGADIGECYFGAARTFGDGEGENGVRRAATFCRGAPLSARDDCSAGFGIIVGLLHATPEARRAACVRLARAEVEACTSAAAAEVDPSGTQSWG